MKHCPYCHIQVGGEGNYCPLCLGPLVGEGQPARYPQVDPPLRKVSLVSKLIAFFLLAGTVVCAAVDFLLTETSHFHWSVLVLAGSVSVLALLHALFRGRRNAPRQPGGAVSGPCDCLGPPVSGRIPETAAPVKNRANRGVCPLTAARIGTILSLYFYGTFP